MSFRNKHWSFIAILAVMLLALTGLTTSTATAATARTLTISASPIYEYAGKSITFSGSVTKSPRGTVVKIQRKSGATWVAAGQTTTTTASGRYSVTLNAPTTPAAYTYRALAPKTSKLAGTYSTRTVKVTVLRKTTATLSISPASISTTQTATFSGSVSPFVTGRSVTIQRLSGSTWVSAGTATLSSTGSYSVGIKPSAAGTFSYRTNSPLTGLNAGTTSATRTLTVSVATAPVITTTSLPDGDQFLAYSATLAKTGGAGTWSIPAATLPSGLSLNSSTGVLSGTPQGSGTRTLSVTFTETGTGLATNKNIPITINPGPVVTNATALPDATQGTAYSVTLTKTGRDGTWSVQGLPTGLSVNATTGIISGTTTAATGTYGVYPTFTETVGGRTAFKSLSLLVKPGTVTPPNAPVITSNSSTIGDGYQDLNFTAQLTKTGGDGTWSVASGTLPGGMTLSPSGVLSATPITGLTSPFSVKFTETATGLSDTRAISLVVYPRPVINTNSLPQAIRGVPYSAPLDGTAQHSVNFPQGGAFTIADLPAGLTLQPSFGQEIEGTTNVPAGDYVVHLVFTENVINRTATKTLTLRVVDDGSTSAPAITTTFLPNGDQGLPYAATLAKTGSDGTWSVPAGTLPGGLTLSPAGVLSGTPTGSGSRTLAITFTETASGLKATKNLPITINAAPAISTTAVPDVTRGAPYRFALELSPSANGTWTVPGLPEGLSVNNFGVITGTTNVAIGEYGIYPKFVEAVTGRTSQKAFSLRVVGTPLAITTDSTLPDGHKDLPYSLTFTKTGGDGTWSAVDIPSGFALNAATGAFTGTPAVAGVYAVKIAFTETSTNAVVNKTFLFKVIAPKVTTTSIPSATTGTAYSVQFTKTGLDGTWGISGALPEGISFTTAGLLSGTPTETGEFGIQVTFLETATGASSKQGYVLHVEAPGSPQISTGAVLPNGKIGTAYNQTLAATPAGGTWAVTQGSLPVGLSLNSTTGAITGTPVVMENAQFVITYTVGSTSNTKFFVLTVPAA